MMLQTLDVGQELLLDGHIRLTLLAIDGAEVVIALSQVPPEEIAKNRDVSVADGCPECQPAD